MQNGFRTKKEAHIESGMEIMSILLIGVTLAREFVLLRMKMENYDLDHKIFSIIFQLQTVIDYISITR